MEKYEFSKEDYLMYKEFFENRINEIEIVSIDSVKQKHDKTFKEVLGEEKEMSKFLRQFIGLEIKDKELEKYKNSFITRKYEKRESDIIYKNKNEEIYYLIEHQSSVDKKMPMRILEYCMEAMREIQKNKTNKEGNPLIIPIVIYTGERKWTVETNFSDTQKVESKYKEYAISLKYKLVDINQYSKEILLKNNTKTSIMMLLEKNRTREEIRDVLIEIIPKIRDKEKREWLREIIEYILGDVLGKDKEKILKLIEEEENDMEEWIKTVKRNEAKKEKELINKVKKEMIKNLLMYNLEEEIIMKCANIKKEEYEKIKKEIQMQK